MPEQSFQLVCVNKCAECECRPFLCLPGSLTRESCMMQCRLQRQSFGGNMNGAVTCDARVLPARCSSLFDGSHAAIARLMFIGTLLSFTRFQHEFFATAEGRDNRQWTERAKDLPQTTTIASSSSIFQHNWRGTTPIRRRHPLQTTNHLHLWQSRRWHRWCE